MVLGIDGGLSIKGALDAGEANPLRVGQLDLDNCYPRGAIRPLAEQIVLNRVALLVVRHTRRSAPRSRGSFRLDSISPGITAFASLATRGVRGRGAHDKRLHLRYQANWRSESTARCLPWRGSIDNTQAKGCPRS